jgi:hypothetical protein
MLQSQCNLVTQRRGTVACSSPAALISPAILVIPPDQPPLMPLIHNASNVQISDSVMYDVAHDVNFYVNAPSKLGNVSIHYPH